MRISCVICLDLPDHYLLPVLGRLPRRLRIPAAAGHVLEPCLLDVRKQASMTPDDYLRMAFCARQLARLATDPFVSIDLKHLAREWRVLAGQAQLIDLTPAVSQSSPATNYRAGYDSAQRL
jgi:hypothetical protein